MIMVRPRSYGVKKFGLTAFADLSAAPSVGDRGSYETRSWCGDGYGDRYGGYYDRGLRFTDGA